MLSVEELSKSYGPQTLFRGASFSVGERARIGLVGPNGSGKSTFFEMLIGEEAHEEGTIRFPRNYTIAHMKQEWEPKANDTIVEAALREHATWYRCRTHLIQCSNDLGKNPTDPLMAKYQKAETNFLALGGYGVEQLAREMLAGLGFKEEQLDHPAAFLSGGWRIRCHLAGLLIQQADLLLLDEPTNHLDVETVVWFESFLMHYPKAVMIISHDHRLISRVASEILEFAPPSLTLWPGTLKKYEELKTIRLEQLGATISNKEKEVARLEDFVRRFRAKSTKARQAQSRLKTSGHFQEELKELKKDLPVISKRPARFHLELRAKLPRTVLEIQEGQFGYRKDEPLFDLDRCVVEGGKKIGVIGVNGVGKSTFLKSCAGELPVLKGEIKRPERVTVGYFAQHSMEQLPMAMSALDFLMASGSGNISEVRGVAASLGLTANDMEKEISVLSGGEKARTTLARILLSRPGLLLLDEPTNHLDLDACEALVRGLADYEGTVLVVSHNRDFLDSLVEYILEIEPGKATLWHGNYSRWFEKSNQMEKGKVRATPNQKSSQINDELSWKEKKQKEAKERQVRSAEKRKQKKQIETLERKLENYKKERQELEAKLCDPVQLKDPECPNWIKRHQYLANRVEQLEDEWLELVEG